MYDSLCEFCLLKNECSPADMFMADQEDYCEFYYDETYDEYDDYHINDTEKLINNLSN